MCRSAPFMGPPVDRVLLPAHVNGRLTRRYCSSNAAAMSYPSAVATSGAAETTRPSPPREGLAIALGPLRQQGRFAVTRRRDHRDNRAGIAPRQPFDQRQATVLARLALGRCHAEALRN